MDKYVEDMTVTINSCGEEVEITAPAFMLNIISLAFDNSAEHQKIVGADALAYYDRDIAHQIYLELKRAGFYV